MILRKVFMDRKGAHMAIKVTICQETTKMSTETRNVIRRGWSRWRKGWISGNCNQKELENWWRLKESLDECILWNEKYFDLKRSQNRKLAFKMCTKILWRLPTEDAQETVTEVGGPHWFGRQRGWIRNQMNLGWLDNANNEEIRERNYLINL